MKAGAVYTLVAVNFRMCLIELWSNKTRSLITSFGIFLGVASLLVNISFIRAMDNDLKKSMDEIGGLSIITIKKKDNLTKQELLDFRRSSGLKTEEGELLASKYPYIRSVLQSAEVHGGVSARGKHTWARAMAVTPDYARVYNYQIDKGRGISREDYLKRNPVCVMGYRSIERLFGPDHDPIGEQITFNGIQFTVIGTIFTEDNFSWRARQMLIPFSIYKEHFDYDNGKVNEIPIELTNTQFIPQAIKDFKQEMLKAHRGAEDFEIAANLTKINEMQQASLGMKILFISIAIITLLVGGISIMNIMFATIGDRIREIGIRKALGANRSDIFVQFLIEAILLCFVGGIPGMVLGASVTFLPKGLFPFYPVLGTGDYVLAAAFTLFAGVMSGMFPALGAAKMQPVEALRF